MTTPLRMPDGGVVFPGQGVPTTSVETEEVAFTGHAAADVARLSEKMKSFIGGEEGVQNLVQAAGHAVKNMPDRVVINMTNRSEIR